MATIYSKWVEGTNNLENLGLKINLSKKILVFSQVVKNLPAHSGDTGYLGFILRSGRPLGGGNGNPLQYSCLEKSHGQGSLAGYTVHGIAELDTA